MSRDYPSKHDNILDIRSVISRVEELREERKPKIVVGYNMPGYMPDSEPSEYTDWSDAYEAMAEILDEHAQADEDNIAASEVGNYELTEDERERTERLIVELRQQATLLRESNSESEYGRTMGKYHFFITDTGETVMDDESDEEELKALESLLEEVEGYGHDHQWEGNWYPVTLVNDDYFVKFAEDEAEQLGLVSDTASWPHNCIDWERAARELKIDYSSANFDGETFWYRSN